MARSTAAPFLHETSVLIRLPPVDFGVWLSLAEHCVRDAGVAGSNPVTDHSSLPATGRVHRVRSSVLCLCGALLILLGLVPAGEAKTLVLKEVAHLREGPAKT